jgi:hypothetical protein
VPPLLTEDPARKKPPLEPDNPFADLVPQAVEPDNPFADLVKAAKPSTYGLEPAPPSAMPVKRKPGFYKSPIPPAVVAPTDVTDITKKAEHTLGHHMPGQGSSLPEAVVESAMEMVTKPQNLAKELILTAPRAGAAWSDYLKGTGTAKEAALKTLQTIALGAAGPAEKAVASRLVSSLGPKLAEAAATTAVGAGAGATFTPDRPAIGAILGAAGGVARLPGAVADLGDVSAGAVEAGTQALKAAPPPPVHTPIDQPQPLSRPQEVLRARLATEGVVPAGPLKRRPAPVVPPPVEPPPDAAAYTTKGAVRRPAAAQPEVRPIERRTENPPDRVTWTPEERARYITDSQKAYAAKINKPWSQWTPEEKAGYFANQTDVRAAAPWKPKNPPPKGNVDAETTDPAYIPTTEAVRYAIKELGAEQFKQAAMAQPHLQPKPGTGEPPTPGMAASGIESAAREIVRKAQQATPPELPTGNPDEIPTIEALKYVRAKLGPEGFRKAVEGSSRSAWPGTISAQTGNVERTVREIVRQDQVAAQHPEPRTYVPSSDPASAEPENARVRSIAEQLKTNPSDQVVREAADEMAGRVPAGAVLVPLPGHTGVSTGNVRLALEIAKRVPNSMVLPVVERSRPVPSSTANRRAGQPGVDVDAHVASLRATGGIPKDRPVILIDNVETTGATGEAARRVLQRPDAKTVTYAKAPIPPGEAPATGAVTWPPLPKEGDLTPVVSSNSEFEARPGVMRAINKGEQPAALSSPLRLPEPTAEDRAIVQPKGYKEISPEEVAARKPAPVAEARPKEPQPATVDESGLFFEHRTPGGELRPFNRVSTEGLIKAHREMQEQITRDQQLAIYRNVEADVSGTQYGVNIQAATKTARGTSQQAEAAQRLRNYEKVMDRLDEELKNRGMTPTTSTTPSSGRRNTRRRSNRRPSTTPI